MFAFNTNLRKIEIKNTIIAHIAKRLFKKIINYVLMKNLTFT